MAEIPNVITGEVIDADLWGNPIRDRTVQRYADDANRDSLNPTPSDGEMAYVPGTAIPRSFFQIQFGGAWRGIATDQGLDFVGPVSIAHQGSGVRFLTFALDRPWNWRQASTGSSAVLQLQAEFGGKQFQIITPLGLPTLTVQPTDGNDSNNWVQVNGGAIAGRYVRNIWLDGVSPPSPVIGDLRMANNVIQYFNGAAWIIILTGA